MPDRQARLPRTLASVANRLAHAIGRHAAAEAHQQLTDDLRRRLAAGEPAARLAAQLEAELARTDA